MVVVTSALVSRAPGRSWCSGAFKAAGYHQEVDVFTRWHREIFCVSRSSMSRTRSPGLGDSLWISNFSVYPQAVQRFTLSPSVPYRGPLKRNFCTSAQFLRSVPRSNDICSGVLCLQYPRHCPDMSAMASSSGSALLAATRITASNFWPTVGASTRVVCLPHSIFVPHHHSTGTGQYSKLAQFLSQHLTRETQHQSGVIRGLKAHSVKLGFRALRSTVTSQVFTTVTISAW